MSQHYSGYLYVALGGALGAVARMIVGHWVRAFAGGPFPWHTFAINIFGCFLLGFIFTFMADHSLPGIAIMNHVVAIGFLGAFTTFSTFELETWNLMSEGKWPIAMAYSLTSVAVGFAALGIGVYAARMT